MLHDMCQPQLGNRFRLRLCNKLSEAGVKDSYQHFNLKTRPTTAICTLFDLFKSACHVEYLADTKHPCNLYLFVALKCDINNTKLLLL